MSRRLLFNIWGSFLLIVFMIASTDAFGEGGIFTGERALRVQLNGLIYISPSQVFQNARYQTGGTGLRNQKSGGITINGVTAPPIKAFVYWAYASTAPGPIPIQSSITVRRKLPGPLSVGLPIPGVLVGTGPDPCWFGGSINVYRGSIPLGFIVTGNALYEVEINFGSTGSTAGQDPWVSSLPPLAEGASIVIIYPGAGTTSIYDTGLSGNTFFGTPGTSYSLLLPGAAPGVLTLWDTIGADGQIGNSRTANAGIADEITTINAVPISGPGSLANDSDWNGGDSTPLPQLWDTKGHNITAATPLGTTTLDVSIASASGGSDCLTPVANIVNTQ